MSARLRLVQVAAVQGVGLVRVAWSATWSEYQVRAVGPGGRLQVRGTHGLQVRCPCQQLLPGPPAWDAGGGRAPAAAGEAAWWQQGAPCEVEPAWAMRPFLLGGNH